MAACAGDGHRGGTAMDAGEVDAGAAAAGGVRLGAVGRSHCNTAPSGQSARDRRMVRQSNAQIFSWLWARSSSPHSSFLPSIRDERSSSARPVVAPFRRSPSSGHQTSIPCASTFPSTSSTSSNPQPASPRPESLRHRRSPLEPLEALLHHRSTSPVVLRPNRPREWIRGELLVLPGPFSPSIVCRRRR